MVATAESTQEQGLSAGNSEIAAAHGEAAEVAKRKRKRKTRPDAGTEFPGVRRKASGMYGAQIWDPLRRTNVWLGTFAKVEDAAKAYDAAAAEVLGAERAAKKKTAAAERAAKKKTAAAELQAAERAVKKKKKKKKTAVDELHAAERAAKKKTAARPGADGVRRGPSGKYMATIWHPLTRAQVYLGSFVTAENAAKAYDAATVKLQDAAGDTNFEVDDVIDVQAVGVGPEKAARSGFRGVNHQPSGKYSARIWDPVRRARLYLGMFDRAEDAAGAYDAEAVRLHGERAITNFERPGMVDLDSFAELQALSSSIPGSIIPGAQLDDDLWTDLPPAELQPVEELLKDMDFTDVAT